MVSQIPKHLKFADTAQIFGIDIYERRTDVQLFQKRRWNLNGPFVIAPFRREVWPGTFDLINSRFLADGINESRWKPLIKEYWQLLKPGGWLQMAEGQWTFRSQSNVDLPALKVWSDAYFGALRQMQKNLLIASDMEHLMRRYSGFERVEKTVHQISIGEWRTGMYERYHT
jgi:SAM-dependent methyltransferase